jgi:hypothetical protein
MRLRAWKLGLFVVILFPLLCSSNAQAAAPTITSLSITTGAVGASVTVTGTNFGSPQGTSTIKFNGTTATATTWTTTSIVTTLPSGATTGNVVVTVSGTASNGKSFTVVPAPSITSLSITTGAVGAAVTVTGTNFGATQGSGTVKFNGTTATVSTWSATSIAVTVPTGATTGNVVVFASGVNSNGISFTVVSAPSITSLSITTGAVGAAVTVTGTNFGSTQGSGTVKFNGTTASITTWAATSIAVTVPTGATSGNVVVFANGVNSNGVSFTVVSAPSITSLSITTGAVGAAVTITGTNFGSSQGSGTVKFNGTAATVTSWSATSIAVTVPSGATTGNVVVFASGVNSNGKSFTVAPGITSLSITTGAVGAAVTITGTTFGASQGTSTVKFNGTTASVTSWSATSIAVTVPSGATTGNVVVSVGGVNSNGSSFTVVSAPSITSLSITTGAVGAAVTITGTNFGSTQGSGTLKFNGTAATVTSWSATSIAVTVPSGATTGNVVVFASGLNSNGSSFTVVSAPSITSLSITTGAVGAAVTVTGTNFGSTQGSGTVKFNGTTASITTWTATSIAVTVPTGATSGNVVVFANGVNSNGKSFTVVAGPNITSLSITSGSPGAPVTVAGTGFGSTQGSGKVQFNGTTATITSWSATSIAVTVPTAATSGNVVVFASGANSNGVNFTVVTLSSITVTLPNLSLPVNSPQQYTATGNYSNGTQLNLTASATWTSSSPSVATISATGLATAVALGQTTIQATAGGINGSTLLTVTGPVFLQVGNLGTARYEHTATRLANGEVLIVGGENNSGQMLASAELYDPATDTFSPTGSLLNPRALHTATLLPDGTVLIAGGLYITPQSQYESLSTAEVYDPVAGTFSYANGTMNEGRFNATATLLNNGLVLLAGGDYYPPGQGETASDSELYDPSAQTFTVTTGALVTPRENHTATLLNDSTVLIVGGDSQLATVIVGAAEIYDPVANTFSATGSLNTATEFHAAALLSTGNVLIAAGYCGPNCTPDAVSRTEIYNSSTKQFTYSTNLAIPREAPTGTVLNNGTVLIGGGQTNTSITGTAEIFDPATQNVTGAGSLATARDLQTATLLSDGTVLFAAGSGIGGALLSAELYAPTPPPPFSLQVTPSAANMLIGSTQQFTAISNIGYPRTDATWAVSDQSLASISTGSSPVLTALAAGQVTITATAAGVSAQAQITIQPAGTNPTPGSALWTVPPVPGFIPVQLAQAMPSDGPDMYSIQSSSGGTQSVVQAFTSDGQQQWQSQLPILNGNSVPDANGGMLVVEYQTCNQGQTEPMTIVDLDRTSGQSIWQITAQGVAGAGQGGSTLYCYPNAPQMAIRADGSVAISASGNTSGLPEFMIVSGQNGQVVNAPNIPPSTYQGNLGGYIGGYSPIGAPIVDSLGNTYVEYEVRNIAYPAEVTSATLYLMEVASGGAITTIQLSSTTQDENLFPDCIIPDGQGGVLATWTIAVGTAPKPTNPYQAAYVVSGAVTASYSLPFTPNNLLSGPDGLPINPLLVLDETGTVAFATDGQSSGDSTNGLGPKVVSFNLSSGTPIWTYQVAQQDTLSLIAVTSSAGGLLINDAQAGVVQLDASGNASQVVAPMGALPQYSWTGEWYAEGTAGNSELTLPLDPDAYDVWATPNGSPSNSGMADALCECAIQTSANGDSESIAKGGSTATQSTQHHGTAGLVQPLSVANCPICDLPPTTPLGSTESPSCTTFAGSGPTYLLLIGDPGLGINHNVGPDWDIVGQTTANYLTASASNNNVVACRVSSVENVTTALTSEGFIGGGVIYIGHGGVYNILDPSTGRVLGHASILEPGEEPGGDYNISSMNYNQLAAVVTAANGSNNIGTTASILINSCRAAVPVVDYYAGGGQELIIAQLISNATQRGVYAYKEGMYVSLNNAAQATSYNYKGEPDPIPASLPLYLIPEGPPGHKPAAIGFTPPK